MKNLRMFLEAEEDSKVIYTGTSWKLSKLVSSSTPHRSETNSVAERDFSRTVPRNAIVICATFRIYWLMGKLLTSADSVNISLDFFVQASAKVEYHPVAAGSKATLHRQASLPTFSGICAICREGGRDVEQRHTQSRRRRIRKTSSLTSLCETNQCERRFIFPCTRFGNDMRIDGTLIGQAIKTGKASDWADLVKK